VFWLRVGEPLAGRRRPYPGRVSTVGAGARPGFLLRSAAVAIALLVGAAVAGCAKTITGHGTPAQAAGSGAPTSGAPSPGTGTGLPGIPLPTGGGQNPDPEIPDSPCDVLDKNKLHQQFGEDADIDRSLDKCQVTSHDGDFVSFNVYSALTLNFEKADEPGGKSTTIAGLPAYITQKDKYIIVSRSPNPDNRGILTCFVGFSSRSQLTGLQIATQLLNDIMPHYRY
jgi:hypothetical protein